MWKAIKYLYYKAYKFYKYEMGDSIPHFMGVLVVSMLFIFIILTILGFTGLFTYIKKQNLFILLSLTLVIWLNIFYYKSRWKKIIKEFENESEKARKRGRILVVLFTIFTIVMFIVSLFVLAFK